MLDTAKVSSIIHQRTKTKKLRDFGDGVQYSIFGVDMRWVTSKTGPVQISWCWRGVANYKGHQTQKFFRRH